MKLNNPMKNPKIIEKMQETRSKNPNIAKKISETRKRLIKEGKIKLPKWTEETRKKVRENMKKNNPMKNPKVVKKVMKTRKEWSLDKKREVKEKISKKAKRRFKDPKYLKKLQKSRHIRPNKSEKILIKLMKENNFPFKYCGDFSVWLGGKNPDFININGQKQVIEFFGDYWHTKKVRDFHGTEWGRKKHYKKWGFDCLVIWGHELDNLELVKNKINDFIGGRSY